MLNCWILWFIESICSIAWISYAVQIVDSWFSICWIITILGNYAIVSMPSQLTSSTASSTWSRSQIVSCTAPNCSCGTQSLLATSLMNENPERWFYVCANFRTKDCGFFRWYNQEVCQRGREVILCLKQRKNQFREENGKMRSDDMHLKQYVAELNSKITKLNQKIQQSKTTKTVKAADGFPILDLSLRFIVAIIVILLVY